MTRVADIMNRDLFHFRPGDLLAGAPAYLLAQDLTGAPILDDDGRPRGVLSLRDCFGEAAPGATVGERMTRPAVTVSGGETVDGAAHLLGETRLHRLVVVDGEGRAIGMVSAVDLCRALVGLAPRRPYPHVDPDTGLSWTDDTLLEEERIDAAPAGPGVLLLVDWRGGAPRVVWGEWTHELRTRLLDLMSSPQNEPALSRVLAAERVWFRAAALPDGPSRQPTVDAVIARHARSAPFVVR